MENDKSSVQQLVFKIIILHSIERFTNNFWNILIKLELTNRKDFWCGMRLRWQLLSVLLWFGFCYLYWEKIVSIFVAKLNCINNLNRNCFEFIRLFDGNNSEFNNTKRIEHAWIAKPFCLYIIINADVYFPTIKSSEYRQQRTTTTKVAATDNKKRKIVNANIAFYCRCVYAWAVLRTAYMLSLFSIYQ